MVMLKGEDTERQVQKIFLIQSGKIVKLLSKSKMKQCSLAGGKGIKKDVEGSSI